jgi:LacI family transcriptional regulator
MQFETRFARDIAKGIIAYTRHSTSWQLRNSEVSSKIHTTLQSAGVIGSLYPPSLYKPILDAGLPLVLVGQCEPGYDGAVVSTDDVALGQMAGDYLAGLGLRHFAFISSGRWPFAVNRFHGFTKYLLDHEQQKPMDFFGIAEQPTSQPDFEMLLERWLQRLPKPCGLFCCNDWVGKEVIRLARGMGLRVPADLAVLGVDDDEIDCEFSEVPLSSIAQPLYTIGYEAARLMDQQIKQGKRITQAIMLPPLKVVRRASTDMLAVDDADVCKALQLIRDNATTDINVAWVVKQWPVNRRSLERRFTRHVGHTLLDEIHRVRFDHARYLLANTTLSLKEVAASSGFNDARYMATCFREKMLISPSEYRSQFVRQSSEK